MRGVGGAFFREKHRKIRGALVDGLDPKAQDTEAFARHILANLRRAGEMRVPVRFWFGRSGGGERPNYQVEFADGSVQAYWNGGACHTAGRFHTANLGEPLPFPEETTSRDDHAPHRVVR